MPSTMDSGAPRCPMCMAHQHSLSELRAEISRLAARLAERERERDWAKDSEATACARAEKAEAERDLARENAQLYIADGTSERRNAETEKELREEAEQERDALRAEVERLRSRIVDEDAERAEYGQHAGCQVNERRYRAEVVRLTDELCVERAVRAEVGRGREATYRECRELRAEVRRLRGIEEAIVSLRRREVHMGGLAYRYEVTYDSLDNPIESALDAIRDCKGPDGKGVL